MDDLPKTPNLGDMADRMGKQLNFTRNALGRAGQHNQLPGSRPDGGMAPAVNKNKIHELVEQILQHESFLTNELRDARNIIDNYERDMAQLQSELAEMKARYDNERARCEELKGILHKAAEVMINGNKP